MPDKAFFDTDVLIYAVAENDPRGPRAEALLASGGVVGVQVLNEFVSVVRRKLRMPWKDVIEALDAIRLLCPSPVPVTTSTHEAALMVGETHGFEIYDGLVIAAAIEAGCTTLYSEYFPDGQIIDPNLTIRNPFR
jgi:predicted nucleic acid-binding protein